jgi:hypothetical protein
MVITRIHALDDAVERLKGRHDQTAAQKTAHQTQFGKAQHERVVRCPYVGCAS